jgi:hypothetical protein
MCRENSNAVSPSMLCNCPCKSQNKYLSKKKRIESLNQYLSALEEKVVDVKEYISELGK